jgi:hypothetical protein
MLVRRVRAIDVTQFALEAFINHMILLRWCHLASVLVIVNVDVRKQCWKRWAEFEAQTTPMAEVVHTLEFMTGIGLVEVHRVVWIVCDCHWGAFKKLRELTLENLH